MDMSEDSDSSNGINNRNAPKRSRHRSPSPRHRYDRDNRDNRDNRDIRDNRDNRDTRDRGRREENRRDTKDTKYGRHRDDRYHKDSRYPRDSRDSRDKNRDERSSRRRSPSYERRSRSPSRRNDYRNNKKMDIRDRKYEKKYDSTPKVNVPNEKQVKIQVDVPKNPETIQIEKKPDTEKDRFFMPGITGRFRDQIERRKLLWQKKDQDQVKPIPIASSSSLASSSTSTKVWQTTTFAQDTDGKVASKFKRLMGIKEQQADPPKQPVDNVMKRQEEMFSSMEQQYEVARTATHTMRGVGLGFGSYQR